jgi:hypothetical protein
VRVVFILCSAFTFVTVAHNEYCQVCDRLFVLVWHSASKAHDSMAGVWASCGVQAGSTLGCFTEVGWLRAWIATAAKTCRRWPPALIPATLQ